ncbi:hypothetical protein SNE40_018516 [Patella caerulea]|uniref:Sorting nexin 14 n=1 Tax=Patella caerulea TaxID=87958 RepID=A0AAN8J560_PATCE
MIPWFIIKHYVQKHSKFSSCVAVLLVFTLLYYSYIKILFAAWSFIIGVAVSYCLLSAEMLVPNFLPMYSRKRKGEYGDDELAMMKTVCTVCGQRNCPRHRPELNILAFQPWTNIEIREKVNQALEEFGEIVMKEFVYTWYKDLSVDEEFTEELRTSIKFLTAVLFRRAKKLDIPNLVTEKIIKAALQHLDCCIQAQKQDGRDIQQATLDYLGSDVHTAMWSRKAEVEYLRCLVESLFPYILKPEALHSKSMCTLVREILAGSVLLPAMDAIANPDMVNNLILIFLDDTPPPEATEPPSPYVPFLHTFTQHVDKTMSCLRLELKDILEQPVLLYSFMQFLKKEAAVNVLQFCLSCEDFNKRILSPDVSQSEFIELHSMAKDLYKSYCDPNALDRINFSEKIINELSDVINSPPEQIVRLRTSFTMFQAYEHAYDLLENTFLPLFHQSDDYYTMLCGDRSGSQSSRNSSRLAKKKDVLSNLSSKLKGVFKANTGEEKLPGLEFSDTDLALPTNSSSVHNDVDLDDDIIDKGHPKHDLSTWRVTIPMIGARPDPENMKRQYFVFIIEIGRADVPDGELEKANWTVARKYGEFYVLEQKLTEFHGEFTDCLLPARKSFGTKNQDFIEGKKEVFELYLQKLLTKPNLKGSELLYSFLTSQSEFNTSFLPDINIGKFVKSMPMKLVKEKGQHLDPFLQAFSLSTEAPKPRSSVPERRGSDASQRSTGSERLSSNLFGNNADCGFHPKKTSDRPPAGVLEVEGVFDSLVYIASLVYNVPKWFYSLLMTLRILFKETLESFINWYINYKVSQVTQEHRLVSIIHLLRDVLFFDTDPPRTDDQKKMRLEETEQGCLDYVPKFFVAVIGNKIHEERTKSVLNILQQPKLNKQLSYVLLDILITELFPELLVEDKTVQ